MEEAHAALQAAEKGLIRLFRAIEKLNNLLPKDKSDVISPLQ